MKTTNKNAANLGSVKNLTDSVKISNKEISDQKKKVVELEKQAKVEKMQAVQKDFLYSLGSQDINATTRKALKIKEQNSKVGLTPQQEVNVIVKTAKEHLKTLPQLHNTQKKNDFFPFLKGSHFAGVLGCLSFQDLFVNVLTGQMLFNPSKYIDGCKYALLSGDVVRAERFAIGEKVYNLIKAVKFNDYDLNEALNELEKLVPYKFDKEDAHPKFSLKQLERIQEVTPKFYKQAYNNCLEALHNELLKKETIVQTELSKVG